MEFEKGIFLLDCYIGFAFSSSISINLFVNDYFLIGNPIYFLFLSKLDLVFEC